MALQKVPGRAIQLDSQATSDVMYHNGTDWVRLAKGEAGQVLVVNDAGTFPQWGTTDWVYRGSTRGFSIGGANHHDQPGGGGTGVWYYFSDIYSHEFANDGNAVDTTGDLVAANHGCSGFSSETHSFVAGGTQSQNVIQSFQNTNPGGNATDLADLTTNYTRITPVSSLTHGYGVSGAGANIEKFAFANTANATLVGNLPNSHAGTHGGGATDSTNDYGYAAGGAGSNIPNTNVIDRFSFVNETTTDDVGDLVLTSGQASGCSSETHGYFIGPGNPSRVQRYAFASSGNATQVATLSSNGTARGNGISSQTHGYLVGGEVHFTQIDKFSFANETTWNDVGDLGTGQTTNRCHHGSSHF
jgi:hypothetical protein